MNRNRRTETEMLALIQNVANEDERIRAVLLNGSRANNKVKKDRYQDFDIIYLVTETACFKVNPNWIDVFGERMILQMPNTMDLGNGVNPPAIDAETYLMIFKDTNRIDLTLVALKDRHHIKDSLTKVLLDKDQLYTGLVVASDVDYWVKKPTEKQFLDCCNEFWWVSTYVIKGLLRNEIIYAKDRMEKPVRDMLMKMLSWYVGVHHNFTINLGASNKYLQKYVVESLWERILTTYANADLQNTWNSLQAMMLLFHETAKDVAKTLDFAYNDEEAENVIQYFASFTNKSFDPNTLVHQLDQSF